MTSKLNVAALAIALAIYQPDEVSDNQADHTDRLYYAVGRADFGSEERKAILYSLLAERLTDTTRLDQAEAIIAEAMNEANKVYFRG